jgi:cold shock CspA family protein
MSDRKHAVVRSWHAEKGFGILRNGPASSLDQYFLHVSCIRFGTATPEVGMEVFFEVDESKPVPEGKLPRAIRADVIVSDDKAGL